MTNSKILGRYGESLALNYLKKQGYRILETNCRLGRLEIDLIAEKNKKIIFFEIKTRRQINSFNDIPLTQKQTNNLKQAINAYCIKNHINFDVVYLDLLIIIISSTTQTASFKHYRNIF